MQLVVTCPDGHNIQGTLERITGVALIGPITGQKKNGRYKFDWAGQTDVDWDSQYTVERDGERVFVCDNGDDWLESQLIRVKGA